MIQSGVDGTMRPEEILETVSCYLGEGGDIKEAETENLVNYLKQTSHEPVVQCTFMNIIRATTKHVVLSKFLVAGGWGVLHNWLVKYNDESNSSLLYELLQVYRVLPVDTALLRANDAAKLIKSLRRSPDEKIKVVAEETINKWMQLVREHTKASSKSGTSSGGKVGKKGSWTVDGGGSSCRCAASGRTSSRCGGGAAADGRAKCCAVMTSPCRSGGLIQMAWPLCEALPEVMPGHGAPTRGREVGLAAVAPPPLLHGSDAGGAFPFPFATGRWRIESRAKAAAACVEAGTRSSAALGAACCRLFIDRYGVCSATGSLLARHAAAQRHPL